MPGFEQHYANENLKLLLRQTLKEVVRSAREQGILTSSIADSLALLCGSQMLSRQGRGMEFSWFDDAIASLERLRDGIITTPEELIAEVGDRNLNARPKKESTHKRDEPWT